MSEEFTLDAYVKQAKKDEPKKEKKPFDKTKKISKNKDKNHNNNNKGNKSAVRRTGGSNKNNSNNNNNNQRSSNNNKNNSRSSNNNNNNKHQNQRQNNNNNNNNNNGNSNRNVVKEKVRTVRPIPEHKRRILRVFNLVPSINNDEFYNLFVKYGTIEESKIETDKKGKSEEKGYVIYRENEAANRAIEQLHEVELEGRVISVEFLKDGERLPGREPRESAPASTGVIHKTIRKDDRNSSRNSHNNDRNNRNNNNNNNNRNNDRRNNNKDRHNNNRK